MFIAFGEGILPVGEDTFGFVVLVVRFGVVNHLARGDVQAADLIREQLGPEASIATPAASLRRAAFLAEIGWERLARGESDDAATLAPIYLHHPQIDA